MQYLWFYWKKYHHNSVYVYLPGPDSLVQRLITSGRRQECWMWTHVFARSCPESHMRSVCNVASFPQSPKTWKPEVVQNRSLYNRLEQFEISCLSLHACLFMNNVQVNLLWKTEQGKHSRRHKSALMFSFPVPMNSLLSVRTC